MTTSVMELLLCFTIGINVGYAKPPRKIINGLESYYVPYQVLIRGSTGINTCGGAILDATHILTAAHCIIDEKKNPRPYSLDILLGTLDANDDNWENIFQIVKKTIHEDVDPTDSWKNDIAVLKLDRQILFTPYRKPIELPINDTDEGTMVAFTGWGATQFSRIHQVGDAFPQYLRFYYGKVLNQEKCQREITLDRIHPGHICVWSNGRGTNCDGDSGGPLTDGTHVVGIASFNHYCTPCYPDVYTRVHKYVEWIKGAMDD